MKLDEIINSWENRPEAFTGQKVDVATFIGPNSEAWNPGAYEQALQMEKSGYSPEYIWQKTGTGRGATGEMRQEISDLFADINKDSDLVSKLNNNNATETGSLVDYLDHDKLYNAYPGIKLSQFNVEQNKKTDQINPNTGETEQQYSRSGGYHYSGGSGGYDENSPTGYAGIGADAMNKLYKSYDLPYKAKKGDTFDLDDVNKYFEGGKKQLADNHYSMTNNMAYPNQTLIGGVDGYNRGYLPRHELNILSTILHENQHGIQSIEGWGGNIGNTDWKSFVNNDGNANNLLSSQWSPEVWNNAKQGDREYEAYRHQPVEAEARLTQTRMNLNEDERRQFFPFNQQTEDNPYGYDVNPQVVKGLLEAFNNR